LVPATRVYADPPSPLVATLIGHATYPLSGPMPFDVRILNTGTTTYHGLLEKLFVSVITPPIGVGMPALNDCVLSDDAIGTAKLAGTVGNQPSPGLAYVRFDLAPGSSITIKAQADLRCGSQIAQAGAYVIEGLVQLESPTDPTQGLPTVYTAPLPLLITP